MSNLICQKDMKAKSKGNNKHGKDYQTFEECVEDIMEDGDVLPNDWQLPHVDQKVYPSKS